jgi:hypothetical protein
VATTDREIVDCELDETIGRLAAKLRRLRPDLFDANGALRLDAASALVRQRTGNKSHLTKEDIIERLRPEPGAEDAP